MSIGAKLPEILLNLAEAGESGVLRAQNASAKKQLVLNDGMIAFAESNLPVEHLANIMIAMNLLKRSELGKVASLMKSGKNSEESILEVNHSNNETINNGMRQQAVVILASLLGWDEFDMRFFPGRDLIKNRRNMGLSVAEMLVASARHAVKKRLVSLPKKLLQGTITANSAWIDKSRLYPLNAIESNVYMRVQDTISATELLPLIPDGDAHPEGVLLCLYILGLIERETPAGSQDPDRADAVATDSLKLLLEDMLERFKKASLYEVLSIEAKDGPDRIQAAYHDLARQFHPDRFQSREFTDSMRDQAEQVFGAINQAYRTLRDPALRSKYDETRLSKESVVEAAIKAKASADDDEEKMIEAIFREGQYSMELGEFEKAVNELKSCVHLRPEKAKYNHFLGLAESEIPKLRKSAEQHFLKVIALESMSVNSHIALVKLYISADLPRKAAGQLDALLRLDPDNPEAKKLQEELNLHSSIK